MVAGGAVTAESDSNQTTRTARKGPAADRDNKQLERTVHSGAPCGSQEASSLNTRSRQSIHDTHRATREEVPMGDSRQHFCDSRAVHVARRAAHCRSQSTRAWGSAAASSQRSRCTE